MTLTVEDIYDAAFDRSRFTGVLETMRTMLHAGKAFIAWNDDACDARFHAQSGGDPMWEQRYAEHFWQHDILRPILFEFAEGECVTVHRRLQDEEIRASVFYREFLAPQRVVDNLAVNLIKRPGMNAHLALIRQGDAVPFSDGDLARLREFVPHLTRAVVIQSRLVGAANIAESHRQIARSARSRVILLSDRLEIMDIDAPLSALLHARKGDRVALLAQGRTITDCIASGKPAVIETRNEEGGPLAMLIEAQPIERDEFGDLVNQTCAAYAIHVTLVDQPLRIAYDAMQSHFRLTATETQVLRHVIDSGDPRSVDQHLGIGRATVRTHLHRIYQKTGARGHGDLSRLAHRFARAWQGPES